MLNNGRLLIPLFVLISVALSACGSGGSSSNNLTTTPNNNNLPQRVTSDNWQNARLVNPDSKTYATVETIGNSLNITINSTDLSNGGEHIQIYLDTDSNAETGFQFEGEAWAQSGVDYIIEDGDLFKSTSNDTSWSWNTNIGQIDYVTNANEITINIPLSYLGEICTSINLGFMTRDSKWDIASFYPTSSRMQNFPITYCNTNTVDTTPPVLSLHGANPLTLELGTSFIDPGVVAFDDVDGNISASITTVSNIDINTQGSYSVTYTVTDLAGNEASIDRTVIVESTLPTGITVDGNSSDWALIPELVSSSDGILKVTDDEEKLYFLVSSNNLGENTQLLLETDNNANTGLILNQYMAPWLASIDYMLENNSLDKSNTNSQQWSWDYGVAPIEFSKTADTLEIAVKKSDINGLVKTIKVGYVSRDQDWNTNYQLPVTALPTYTQEFDPPVSANNPPIAKNDSATTDHVTPITMDVLSNDSDPDGDPLKIISVSNTTVGEISIVDNKINYDPQFTHQDVSVSYTISDSRGGTSTATININSTNTPPILLDDTATTTANTPISIHVIANDGDNEGDYFEIISVSQSNFGNAIIDDDILEDIIFDPQGNTGTATFTYTVEDEWLATSTATVTVTVNPEPNNPPIANNDSVTTIGTQPVTIRVLDNDTDPDSDTLSVLNIIQPQNGTVSPSRRNLAYIANPGFVGNDSFSYTITDNNGGTASATVSVIVSAPPVNNPPDAVEDSVATDFDKAITVNVLANDTDPDGDTLSVLSIVQPPVGIATLNTDGSILFDPQSNVGSISIGYTVSDGRGGTDFAVLTVASSDPNDGNDAYPTISNENVSTPKNTSIFIDVLANDFDADGDILILDQVDQGQNGTTAKVTQNGVLGVLYTPNPGFVGTDEFYYGVHDGFGHNGSGKTTITVNP